MVENDRKIAKNSIYLLTRTLILTLISLYTVREILHVLGVESFGIFNLIYGLVALFTFANGALTSSTQRFLSYKIGENSVKDIKNVFYSSFEIHFYLAVFVLTICYLLKDYILMDVLNVNNKLYEANIIYILALISIFISIIQSPFTSLITSYEKMEIFAYVSLFEAISKLLVVYVLYFAYEEKLILYGKLLLVISVMVFLIYFYLCFKNFKFIFKKINEIEIKKFRGEILSFIGWSLFGNLAWVSRVQGTNIILNIFYGVKVNAVYAISVNVTNVINSFFTSVSNAIKPQIFKSYAQNNLQRFYLLISKGTKYNLIIYLVLIMPLLITLNEILIIWLKAVPEKTDIFIKYSLIVLFFEIASTFLIAGIQAVGKMNVYQIVLGILILLNLPIIYILFSLDFNVESFFYVLISISVISLIFRLLFINKYTGYSFRLFFGKVLLPVVILAIILYLLDIYIYGFMSVRYIGLINFILIVFLMVALNIILAFLVALDETERKNILFFLRKM